MLRFTNLGMYQENMDLFFAFLLFVVSTFFLIRSGSAVVRHLSHLAVFLGVTEFLASFLLISFATSLPELFVGISGAVSGTPIFAFAAIGSNILHATIIIGLAAVVARRLPVHDSPFRLENFMAVGLYFFPLVLLIDGALTRLDGIIILGGFLYYLTYMLQRNEAFRRLYTNTIRAEFRQLPKFFLSFGTLFFAIIVLVISALGVVKGAQDFASILHFSPLLIAVFFIGFGVALPELSFNLQAARRGKHEGMILGNLFGAWAMNSGLVLGLVALIRPFTMPAPALFWTMSIFSFLSVATLMVLLRTGKVLTWREGVVMITLYILFVFTFVLFESTS